MKNELIASAIQPEIPPPEALDVSPAGSAVGAVGGAVDAGAGERRLGGPVGEGRRMSRDEIREVVEALGGLLKVLRSADAADVAEVYRQLGLTLTYDHETQKVLAETQPAPMCLMVVSEDRHAHYAHALNQRTTLVVA
ncbi:hypothetical protein [Streptantibioticus silvisoli]|uniref:Uncharacterized protein n=1 Tax=Streptantibioticus silvisoli TaxID=2705255 RepID=A0ABT6W3M4_9ACTN|nr:hypothetical protein [Streptantibioticus silvisoli]MDI5964116.1 hypothetical protein [Streptantibioticus silvisoli]